MGLRFFVNRQTIQLDLVSVDNKPNYEALATWSYLPPTAIPKEPGLTKLSNEVKFQDP